MKKLLSTVLVIMFFNVADGQKPVKIMEMKKSVDSWPVPKNPVEGEMWKQNGHYWLQHNGEMEIVDFLFPKDSLGWYREAYQQQLQLHSALITVIASVPYPILENIKDSTDFKKAEEKYFAILKKYQAWQLSH